MMKKFRPIWISTLLALLISLAVVWGYDRIKEERVTYYSMETPPSEKVLYTADSDGNIKPLDFREASRKVLEGVVHVTTEKEIQAPDIKELPDPFRKFFRDHPFENLFPEESHRLLPELQQGSGSGVIINEKGYIITNNHVVDDATTVHVSLHDNSVHEARVVGTDPATDLALLKIEKEDLKAIPLVDSDEVEIGEWVLAVGNPFSLTSTVTAGIVSAKARNIQVNSEAMAVESFIQTDAAINPGNSGGALVNLQGGLIGINTAIASRTGTYNGYGFAVPSNIVAKVVEDILEYGVVQRAVLGVMIRTMDGRLAEEKGTAFHRGVWVEEVRPGSAAKKAGLQAGDIIRMVDGTRVDSSPALQEQIARRRPGDRVQVEVLRNGEELVLEVLLDDGEGSTELTRKKDREILKLLGAEFETLDSEQAEDLNVRGGVKVKRLLPGTLRETTRMREGFVITHLDGKPVTSVERFRDLLDQAEGGVMVEGRYPGDSKTYYYGFGLR